MKRACIGRWRVALVAMILGAVADKAIAAQEQADDETKRKAPATRELQLADDLAAEIPSLWKQQKASSRFRTHQFLLPRAKGDKADGSLIVYHFGKGGGGGLEANLKRWYGMVEQPDGKASEKVAKPKKMKSEKVTVTWIDVGGTYLHRPAPFVPKATRMKNYRLFAAYVDGGAQGPYYMRAYGPEKTMKAHRGGFEAMLKSIRLK